MHECCGIPYESPKVQCVKCNSLFIKRPSCTYEPRDKTNTICHNCLPPIIFEFITKNNKIIKLELPKNKEIGLTDKDLYQMLSEKLNVPLDRILINKLKYTEIVNMIWCPIEHYGTNIKYHIDII